MIFSYIRCTIIEYMKLRILIKLSAYQCQRPVRRCTLTFFAFNSGHIFSVLRYYYQVTVYGIRIKLGPGSVISVFFGYFRINYQVDTVIKLKCLGSYFPEVLIFIFIHIFINKETHFQVPEIRRAVAHLEQFLIAYPFGSSHIVDVIDTEKILAYIIVKRNILKHKLFRIIADLDLACYGSALSALYRYMGHCEAG